MEKNKEQRGCCGQDASCCCCSVEWAMWGNMNALYAAASERRCMALHGLYIYIADARFINMT